MRTCRLLLGTLLLSAGFGSPLDAAPRHHRHPRAAVRVGYAPPPAYDVPPLAGTVGTPIPPEAARFMGYPYNVPGYRYVGVDACLLRVGGPFGPGPSAGPCPFGLDRAF